MPKPITAEALQAAVDAFDWATWSSTVLGPGYRTTTANLVQAVGKRQAKRLGGSWNPKDPYTSQFMTEYVGERITQLTDTTVAKVRSVVQQAWEASDGLTTVELGKQIQIAVEALGDEMARSRANTIARTETAIVENNASVLGIRQNGGDRVDVFDGTDDEVCAAANGQVWTIEQALADPVGHPNCVRAFAPHIDD
jgi:hypothetical protein